MRDRSVLVLEKVLLACLLNWLLFGLHPYFILVKFFDSTLQLFWDVYRLDYDIVKKLTYVQKHINYVLLETIISKKKKLDSLQGCLLIQH